MRETGGLIQLMYTLLSEKRWLPWSRGLNSYCEAGSLVGAWTVGGKAPCTGVRRMALANHCPGPRGLWKVLVENKFEK